MHASQLIQDRYRLIAPLGAGGMAEVWKAEDTRLERPVAVKLLAPHLTDDPEFLVRFFSEAQSVAQISHPAVVAVLDFGEFEGRPYLVMEYAPGGSLADLDDEPLTVPRILELIAAAARGVGAAHEQGVVHRDVKPGNILLDEQGRAKVADFGIASGRGNERLTATNQTIGSPHYISPEQVSGADATPASDVYSFGVVLYELLTRTKPFEADNVTAIAIAHVEREPDPPSSRNPELTPAVDSLLLACLAKDPERRPANGRALADRLEALLSAVSGDATAPVPLVSTGPVDAAPTRSRSLFTSAAILLVFGLAALGVLFARNSSEGVAEGAAPAPRQSKQRSASPSVSPSPTSLDGETTAVAAGSPSPSPSASPTEAAAASPSAEPKASPSPKPKSSPSPEPKSSPSPKPSPSPTTGSGRANASPSPSP